MRICDVSRIGKMVALVGWIIGMMSRMATAQQSQTAPDYNATILYQIAEMPSGGDYMAGGTAMTKLQNAVSADGTKLTVNAQVAMPSFCSSATYLVFLKAVGTLQDQGVLRLNEEVIQSLARIADQPDGRGVWGRWNANGPGTARLFRELGLGSNFTDYAKARPGDFMKIFWSDEVGKLERGHSVIFLDEEKQGGVDSVRFWSSNLHVGYSQKVVPKSKIARVIFSRLEHPERLAKVTSLPRTDGYLAGLLDQRSDWNEVRGKCGF